MLIGVVIISRVRSSNYDAFHRKLLLGFSALVMASGGLCVIAEKHTFGLSPVAKVPLYAVVGVSVTFALVFSAVDLLNYCSGRPLVETPSQVIVVLCVSVIMGAIYGFVFGMLDVEDQKGYRLQLQLMREEKFCFPVGGGLGAVAGFLILKLRRRVREVRYDPLSTENFYDDEGGLY